MRKTFREIQEVLSGISDMGMIEVGPSRTYSLAEFCSDQFERIQKLDSKLLDFRNLLRATVYDACRPEFKCFKFKIKYLHSSRSTFLEAGFNADDYANELEELKKTFVPEPTKTAGPR